MDDTQVTNVIRSTCPDSGPFSLKPSQIAARAVKLKRLACRQPANSDRLSNNGSIDQRRQHEASSKRDVV